MEEFAKKLGIEQSGELDEDKYVIPLADSEDYAKMYTLLDNSEFVYLDTSLVTARVSQLDYTSDEGYTIKLIANFDDNLYKVVIEKEETDE